MELNDTIKGKLKEVLSLMNDGLTRKEFTNAFRKVIEIVKQVKQTNEKEIDKLKALYKTSVGDLGNSNTTELSSLKQKFENEISKILKDQEVGMNLVRDKLRVLRHGEDGKDADEAKIVQEVLNQIQMPDSVVLDTPEQIRDKLETLQDEERLEYAAVKGVVGIHIGETAPEDKAMLWVDTTDQY